MFRGKRLGHLKASYRSGLEVKVGAEIEATTGKPAAYEVLTIPYVIPAKEHKYTPDWFLLNGIVVETKGIFDPHDRQKILLVREQWPDMDLRMVFSNAQAKLYKGSPTTYAMWCDKHGIQWAHKQIPKSWINEPIRQSRLAAAKAFEKVKKTK